MTPRYQFVIAFVASLVISALFYTPYFCPSHPTNQEFKHAGSAERVTGFLAEWGEAGLETAQRNLMLDWLFIAVYVTMWITASRAFWPDLVWTKVALVVGLAGAAADIVENICLWNLLHGHVSDAIARTCKTASSINVPLFILTGLYFLIAAIGSKFGR